jgi:phosphoglycolate phosphatase-like HAD superfamily hydrolase
MDNQKIIVFDFDGVVCDSTDECMVSSWNAWETWESRSGFRKTVAEFSDEDKENFKKVRPRVRGAGEYYILRRAFTENIRIDDQQTYQYLEEQWKKYLIPFKSIFFDMRNRLRQENLDQWIDLHPIYDNVIDVMKTLNDKNKLYIATLKDAESVRLILAKQGLTLLDERLLDQAQIKSKLQALDQFRHQIGCEKIEMIFIDDNVTHLLEPKSSNYPVFLTTWGSTMKEYLDIAEQNNIPLLNDCKLLINSI